MFKRIAAMVGGLVIVGVTGASAQTWDDRLFVNVNIGVQTGSTTSSSVTTPQVYGEAARIAVTRTLDSKPLFDVTAGRPFFGNLGVAVSFSARSSNTTGTVESSIPDPIEFDRPRNITSSIPDMAHSERWFAVLATWFAPVGEKSDVMLFAGPAVVAVRHEVVDDVTVAEVSGSPVLTATLQTASKSLAGFQLGADYRYMLTPQLGVGAFMGFTRASGSVVADTRLTLGGFRLGGGARLRF